MKWVTRQRIQVNRTATCWLIAVELARVIQAADFNDQLDDDPAARGLQLISRGFPLVTTNDHETAKRASFVYDALYASIKSIRAV